MAQSDSDIQSYIQNKLGGDVVDVELTQDQYDGAIKAAKSWFATYIGQLNLASLNIDGPGSYDVADDVETVVDVVPNKEDSNLFDAYDWADVDLSPMFYSVVYGVRTYSTLVQYMQHLEQAKRIIGSDQWWEWDEAARKLRIGSVDISGIVWYYYLSNTVDLSKLKQSEYDMVRRYALAEAMETLGRIRSKYSEIPSATGSFALNGDNLLSDATEMKQELTEKINKLGPPVGFLTG